MFSQGLQDRTTTMFSTSSRSRDVKKRRFRIPKYVDAVGFRRHRMGQPSKVMCEIGHGKLERIFPLPWEFLFDVGRLRLCSRQLPPSGQKMMTYLFSCFLTAMHYF